MTSLQSRDLSVARSLQLHVSGQAMMYDIQRRVRGGYVWWTGGDIAAGKVLAVVAKFGELYGVFLSRFARSRRKAAGQPSAVLFVWAVRNDPEGYTTQFRFLLLATEHLDGEVMFDGRRSPVRVDLYHRGSALYHLTPTCKDDKYSYVWQLSPKSVDRMHVVFQRAAGEDAQALLSLLQTYKQLPLTSGYRIQLKAALMSAQPIWRRNTRPSVQMLRAAIKAGTSPDPFKAVLPFVSGFPVLFADPPMTLKCYLALNDKRRIRIQQERRAAMELEHPVVEL